MAGVVLLLKLIRLQQGSSLEYPGTIG